MVKRNKGSKKAVSDDIVDAMSELFTPLPPYKRIKLNKIVGKLLGVCSNFTSEPSTPAKLLEEHVEIRGLVEKARALESRNMNRKLYGPRISRIRELVSWIEYNGGEVKGVSVKEISPDELGLFVDEEVIKEGDFVLKIPRKCVLSSETARDSCIGSFIEKDAMLRSMSNVALALHLLVEKNGPASLWEPYINALPHTYSTVLYYSLEDFEALKGSPAFTDALKQYKFVARQYAYFYTKFETTLLKDYFTFDEYRWAVSTVMTRQNEIPGKPDADGLREVTNALIPFWDMANHRGDPASLSTDFDPETDSLRCLSNRDFKKGEEFTIYYGLRGNVDFLIHNGFVPSSNPNNFYSLKLGIGKKDALFALKSKLVEKFSGVCSQGCFYLTEENPVDDSLMTFLRINSMTETELSEYISDEEKSATLHGPNASTPFDKKALDFLKIRCQLLIKSYPDCVEKDEEILKEDESLSLQRHFCVHLRRDEKRILSKVIEFCDKKSVS